MSDGSLTLLLDLGRPAAPAARLPHEGGLNEVAFRPGGAALLTGSQDGTARLWAADTGAPRTAPLRHAGPVREARFSRDGRLALTACELGAGHGMGPFELRAWEAGTGQPLTPPYRVPAARRGVPLPTRGEGGRGGAGAFSPNGDRLALPAGEAVALCDLSADERPAGELVALTRLLALREVNEVGAAQPLPAEAFRAGWPRLRGQVAGRGPPAPRGADWHRQSLDLIWQERPPGTRRPDEDARARAYGILWHLDRLPARERKRAERLEQEGWACLDLGRWERAAVALGRAAAAGRAGLELPRARAHAELGRWGEARRDLERAVKKGGPLGDGTAWRRLALVRLRRGDLDGYRAACAALVKAEASGDPRAWMLQTRRLFPLLLHPDPGQKAKAALPLFLKFPRARDARPLALGAAALLRSGAVAKALVELRGTTEGRTNPANWFLQALAEARHGQRDAARAALERGVERLKDARQVVATALHDPVEGWEWLLAAELLRQEAEAALAVGKAP
jgi:tetratricopeptide (TPR) repeat protein